MDQEGMKNKRVPLHKKNDTSLQTFGQAGRCRKRNEKVFDVSDNPFERSELERGRQFDRSLHGSEGAASPYFRTRTRGIHTELQVNLYLALKHHIPIFN